MAALSGGCKLINVFLEGGGGGADILRSIKVETKILQSSQKQFSIFSLSLFVTVRAYL